MPRNTWIGLPALINKPINARLLMLSLALIAGLVFINAINHPFVHDDIVFILQNPQISRLDHLPDIFTQVNHLEVTGTNAYYRPILEIVYRLEYKLFGFNSAGFHLINILVHICNGLLIFVLLCRLQFTRWMAYAISLLFLIHPVQTEAVACVAGISNILVVFFVLIALYFYIKEEFIVALAAVALALLTKEQAVIIPLLFLLIDCYQRKKNRYGLWFMVFMVTFGFLWLRSHITGAHMLEDILKSPGELKLRLLAIPRTLLMYLTLIVAPFDLHYYRNTDILKPNLPGFIGLGVLIVGLIYLVRQVKAKASDIFLGIAWFVICLLPVLNVVPLVNEYSFILTAEHFLYLPIVGIGIVIAVLLQRIFSKRILIGLGISVALSLGAISIYQNTFWRAEIPLFERMIQFEPHFGRGHILLASAYQNAGQLDLAVKHYGQALEIMTNYSKKSVNANATRFYKGFMKTLHLNIAQCYMTMGQWEQSLFNYQKALEIDPNDSFILNNIAICYIQMGDKTQAEQYLKLALGLNPTFTQARDNLNKLIATP